MLLPSKVTSYRESILSSFPVLLDALDEHPCSVSELYRKIGKKVGGLRRFMDGLVCLYALKAIDYNEDTGEVNRAC